MRLLLIAPTLVVGGHHPIYVSAILTEASSRKWRVDLVTAPGDLNHAMGFTIIDAVEQTGGNVTYCPFAKPKVNGLFSWAIGQWQRWNSVHQAWVSAKRKASYDVVFVLDGDGWYVPSLVFGPPVEGVPLVTIMLRLRYQWDLERQYRKKLRASTIQRTIFESYLRLNWVAAVCVCNASLMQIYRNNDGSWWSRKLHYVPDFGQTPILTNRAEARRRLGLPAEGRIVACVGGLGERKNLFQLFQALGAPVCPGDICALLMGQVAPEFRARLRDGLVDLLLQRRRLFLFEGAYNAEQLSLALSAADCAWLCYRQHLGSSGFLWEAAQAGLPIVGCAGGEIAHQIESLKLGLAITDEDPAFVALALDRATRPSEETRQWRENCLLAGMAHTSTAFGRAVCEVIQEASTAGS